MSEIGAFLDLKLFSLGKRSLQVGDLFVTVLIFVVAAFLLWLFKKYLKRLETKSKLDPGKSYAISQVVSYIVYIITIISAIDSLGFEVTVLLASSTALLVGIGLGLQDVFKDMVAGFIILFERAVTAGDIIVVDNIVGEVREVGLRTTSLFTRDDIVMIVPNSKLTTENVINWTQNSKDMRFQLDVGVAYGSDTALVRDLLIRAAEEEPMVNNQPKPKVFFQDFGDSALIFTLLFHSKNLFRIENTKSDLRFKIDALFREHGVQIPFPQRDLWLRNYPAKD